MLAALTDVKGNVVTQFVLIFATLLILVGERGAIYEEVIVSSTVGT